MLAHMCDCAPRMSSAASSCLRASMLILHTCALLAHTYKCCLCSEKTCLRVRMPTHMRSAHTHLCHACASSHFSAHCARHTVRPKQWGTHNASGPQQNRFPHNREGYVCRECVGAGICEHGRQRRSCKNCGGSSICEHGRQRNRCRACEGSSICEHNRERYSCVDCG
jgi:hypothetical protein